MHLYMHEFTNPKDVGIKEVRDLLFDNSLKDYQARTGKSIEKLEVSKTKHGKPHFASAVNMHFSISHSGRYWVCLFDDRNIGVDVEDYSTRNMTIKRFNDISARFFLEDEQEYVLGNCNVDDEDRPMDEGVKNRFFRIWTAKEAYMKYTGNGFSQGFKNFSVLDDSLKLYFKDVPVDPTVVLTFCSDRKTKLDELINL